jgi:DNA sulfur modification protein DndD
LRREADKTGKCPICKKDHQHSNQEQNQEDGSETTHLEEELQLIRTRARVLERLGGRSARSGRASAVAANIEAQDALSLTESAISDLEEKLAGVDEADVRDVAQRYSDQKLLFNTATNLRKEREDNLTEARKNIDTLTAKLIKEGSGQEIGLKARVNLINDLIGFFDQAADDYREDQKARVEKAATKIFLSTAEHVEGLKGLRITENYGLEIMQLDGTVEDLRSSGIEHIIAVSLIGALQETSPVKGPVVMDSPFGRLDSKHRDRVMNLLPDLAPQVLLLAHDRELEEGAAADVLDPSRIIAERKLRKISRNQTVLEPLGGGSR